MTHQRAPGGEHVPQVGQAHVGAGLVACHTPNWGARSPIEAKIFKGLGVRAGIPDVLALHEGQLFGMTVTGPWGAAWRINFFARLPQRCYGAPVTARASAEPHSTLLRRVRLQALPRRLQS
jgi:hypothetical protein